MTPQAEFCNCFGSREVPWMTMRARLDIVAKHKGVKADERRKG